MFVPLHDHGNRAVDRQPASQSVQERRPESRVGAVLGDRDAHAGPRERHPGSHGQVGRRDSGTQLPGSGALAEQRERH